jgi:hypothetical protein
VAGGINKAHAFLTAYAECGNVTKAAEAAGIDRRTHSRHLKKYPAYRALFEKAAAEAAENLKERALARIEALDDAIYTRAVEGWVEPVVYQGKFTYGKVRDAKGRIQRSTEPLGIRKFSDSDAQFLLRGLKPEMYRERHEVSGSVDLNVTKFKGSLTELLATFRELTQESEEKE